MASDFFLENRAHQIRRLCRDDPLRFQIPSGSARNKLPKELVSFCSRLERICEGASASENPPIGLSDKQREDLEAFEREVVRLRFSSNDKVKNPVVQLIKAIFADAEYFSGLKPLPQHTDVFAFERLFPSWLNLLSATMLPQAATQKPRLEGKKQGALFEFLGKLAIDEATEAELVGLLTFVARRFDAPDCEELLQRFADLFSEENASMLKSINSFEQDCKDAKQFALRLRNYLIVRHSLYRWPSRPKFQIAYARPAIRSLPKSIESLLNELDESKLDWTKFFRVAVKVSLLVKSDNLLSSECVAVLEQHTKHIAELLDVFIQDDGPLPEEAQQCLAFIIDQEDKQENELPIESLNCFASELADRFEGFDHETLKFFCRHLLLEANNRRVFLDACTDETKRARLTEIIVKQARLSDEDERFLSWLACASVVSPDPELAQAKRALQALAGVVQNRSIGNREYADLVHDLRSEATESLKKLAVPIRAAGGKNPRLAALYMTLNEISETLAGTGKVGNFSVVRAKYVRLTNLDVD